MLICVMGATKSINFRVLSGLKVFFFWGGGGGRKRGGHVPSRANSGKFMVALALNIIVFDKLPLQHYAH